MDLMQWLTESTFGRLLFTALVSMVPVVELRGGIPFGVGLGLGHLEAFCASLIGNMVPVPFIIVYIRRIFKWMRVRSGRLDRLVTRLEERAHLKSKEVTKYRALGLCIFVATPMPGTGAWMGSLVAAILDMRLRDAFPSIFLGMLLTGIAISAITYGVTFFVL